MLGLPGISVPVSAQASSKEMKLAKESIVSKENIVLNQIDGVQTFTTHSSQKKNETNSGASETNEKNQRSSKFVRIRNLNPRKDSPSKLQ